MAAKKILVPYDFSKNEIQNAVIQVLASAPGSPVEGQIYYNSTDKKEYYHNGTTFVTDTDRSRHSGTQTASTISDFDTQVRTSRLDQMAAPTGSVSMNSQKITNLASGTSASDAVTLQQLQDQVAGISWKDEVAVATTATGTLATAYENGDVVDGYTLVTGDRILIKDQSTASENGIYTVNASGAPTRATDADSAAEIRGAAVFVANGTTNGGTRWVLNNTGTITIGSTSLTFVQFGGGATYTAGNGLTLSGNDFNVGAGTGITVNANDVAVDVSVVARKATGLIGNGSSTSIVFTHSLSNQWCTVQVYEVATLKQVECDIELTSSSTCTLIFAVAPASNAYRVIVTG